VWALAAVVVDVDPQNVLEVAAAEDQQPVQTFVADGADKLLRVGVRLRRQRCEAAGERSAMTEMSGRTSSRIVE
jgi:hypothetical protein